MNANPYEAPPEAPPIAKQPPPQRQLLVLLIVAWVVVDLILAFTHVAARQWLGDIPAAVILWGMLFGQFATLSAWLALGDGRWFLRWPATIFAFFLIHGLVRLIPTGRLQTDRWLGISAAYAGLIVVPLLGMRLFGWACRTRNSTQPPRFQFSILQIIGLTTLVAATLGILRQVRVNLPNSGPIEFALIELSLAGIAWVACLAMLRLPLAAGWLVVLAVAPLLGWLAGAIEGHQWEAWIGFAVIQAVVFATNLMVFRIAGYELRRSSVG
jgi:hypothetical protein